MLGKLFNVTPATATRVVQNAYKVPDDLNEDDQFITPELRGISASISVVRRGCGKSASLLISKC